MSLYDLLIISLALSLDAFGVALSIGLDEEIKLKNKIGFVISFGFFQFLFSIIGAYAGVLFNTYIASVPKIVGGVLISVVGALMIREGFEDKEEDILLSVKMYFILGISVSIDAMVIGFTVLNNIQSAALVFKYTIIIGLVTLIVSSIAFIISRYLRKIEIVTKYADYIGGIILLIFGIKMMFF
jgi:putative Mn2+ efflux pump MntP